VLRIASYSKGPPAKQRFYTWVYQQKCVVLSSFNMGSPRARGLGPGSSSCAHERVLDACGGARSSQSGGAWCGRAADARPMTAPSRPAALRRRSWWRSLYQRWSARAASAQPSVCAWRERLHQAALLGCYWRRPQAASGQLPGSRRAPCPCPGCLGSLPVVLKRRCLAYDARAKHSAWTCARSAC